MYLIDSFEPVELQKIADQVGSEGGNLNKYKFQDRQTLVELP